MKRLIYFLLLFLSATPLLAQDEIPVESSPISHSGIMMLVYIIGALLLLMVMLVLLRAVKVLSNELLNPSIFPPKNPVKLLTWEEWEAIENAKPSIWNKILSLRPLSEEKDMMLDHEFDGIGELDNPTPPWFMWLFYSTIAFAVIYILNFHVLGYGKMQEEEYAIEMKEAAVAKIAYLAKAANNVDENNVKEDPSKIAAGAAIYNANCVACHGDKGQGGVGPNLTDKFWIHGGSIGNIFKTIKYGVPEKGMISWEKTLNPKQMAELSNYVLSLKGTNPPNPKAPQGLEE